MGNCHLWNSVVNVVGARMKENGTEQAGIGLRFRRSRVRNLAVKQAVLIEVFCDFVHCLQTNSRAVPQPGYTTFLANLPKFIVQELFFHSMLRSQKEKATRRIVWVSHIYHPSEKDRNKFFVRVHKSKTTLESPKRRWEDNIKTDMREITR